MSKETIKLYSHDGTLVKVAKFYKNDHPEIGWRSGWFKSYEDAEDDLEFRKRVDFAIPNCDDKLKKDIENLKNDLDIIKRLERLEDKRFESIDTEQVHLSERIEKLSRKLNGKDNRVDALSDKIDNIKKESKRGQDLLLDRIKELESENNEISFF
jgi:predicted RNase H-like nuclease (RuvC/YqgF family)